MNENKMRHYYIDSEKKEEDFFSFIHYINGDKYIIHSCKDVFSKNDVDYGSNLLIHTIIKKEKLSGRCLDLGCGYGVIGIALAKNFPDSNWVMADINNTAVELTKKNITENGVKNIESVLLSNLTSEVEGSCDYIVTNPPIRTGKELLFQLVDESYEKLKEEGIFINVIKKKHGLESFRAHLLKKFRSVEILKKDKGYYILKSYK